MGNLVLLLGTVCIRWERMDVARWQSSIIDLVQSYADPTHNNIIHDQCRQDQVGLRPWREQYQQYPSSSDQCCHTYSAAVGLGLIIIRLIIERTCVQRLERIRARQYYAQDNITRFSTRFTATLLSNLITQYAFNSCLFNYKSDYSTHHDMVHAAGYYYRLGFQIIGQACRFVGKRSIETSPHPIISGEMV